MNQGQLENQAISLLCVQHTTLFLIWRVWEPANAIVRHSLLEPIKIVR